MAYEAAEQIVEELTDEDEQVRAMAERIEAWCQEVFDCVLDPEQALGKPSDEALSLVSDVGSMWRVDFDEIAQTWIEEVRS